VNQPIAVSGPVFTCPGDTHLLADDLFDLLEDLLAQRKALAG